MRFTDDVFLSREGYTVNTKGVRKPTASGHDGVVANPEDQSNL